jgi:hypothetical protein
MRSRLPLFAAAGFFAVIVLAWWLWPRERELLRHASPAPENRRAGEPTPPAARHQTPLAERSEPVDIAPMDDSPADASEAQGDQEHAPAATGDLLTYVERPMSAVPHRVIRGWGASDENSHLGLVGAYVIVEPRMTDEQLTQLCVDIQEYHRSANALSVKIFDSEGAATYDRHIDGGELKNRHQVATVTHDSALGLDAIHVRGELVVKP